jgi:hypothetical protein
VRGSADEQGAVRHRAQGRGEGQEGKSLFLIIQLLPQFDFSHRTLKPDIFDHPTLTTAHNWPSAVLMSGFNFLYSQFSP